MVAAEPHGGGAGVMVATAAANVKIAEAHGDGGGAGVVVAAHAGGVFLCSGPQRGANQNPEGIADPVGAFRCCFFSAGETSYYCCCQ
jgi:hypothetical protein